MMKSPATTTSPHTAGSQWKRLGAALATGLLASDHMALAEQAPSLPRQPARPAVTRRIIVSIPDRKLALLENGEVVNVFPLGTRWMGLSAPGFGIHGTNDATSIGRPRSHGCIRMRNSDVERLFSRVQSGDVVELRGERTVETAQLFTAP